MTHSGAVPAEPAGRPVHDDDRGFFGHPRGLMTLFTTEMWERFSYYGMRAILLYYLTDTAANGGLGFDTTTGEAFVAVYGTSVYLLSIVGGWLADRVIGARRSVLWGGLIIAAGHVLLTIPGYGFSMSGIACVALGTGLLKPNVSSMVGELYARDDERRDPAFSIFYMGINIGSFTAPFLVGIAERWGGYHAGFSVAAVGMGIALVFFVLGGRYLGDAGTDVPNPITPEERPAVIRLGLVVVGAILVATAIAVVVAGGFGVDVFIDATSYLALAVPVVLLTVMYRSKRVTDIERPRVLAYIPLFVAAMLFWMIFEQAATTLATFAKERTDLDLWGIELSPSFFQSINPASIILLAPVFAWIWTRTGDRPPTAYKFVIGLALAATSFLFLSAASAHFSGTLAPPWVLVTVYVIQTLGELCLSPVGLAATTLLAPKAFRGQAMALWFLASAAGQAITAQTIEATEGVSDTAYFGWIGVVAMVFAGILLLLAPWVTRHIKHADELERAAASAAPEGAAGDEGFGGSEGGQGSTGPGGPAGPKA
ncbi:POT family proton-dependent oligopeptide transporter [Sediminihabitans luteus]|uniref:POT family proton-dependent oligopeptide transporter n=1 Tax=Sediminihabitans luteus TaxID=1138585 RepID=A0A2M9CPC7_9CELL|nr:peptide MFS transporter [Sediminihabitans luteus]PJJ73750.1 POT family proton-dependent oligopeptide transporter [Sediminihabitans luteus]GIJ00519.1 peptide ABC transporter permease [Sediminihabitans luteus]